MTTPEIHQILLYSLLQAMCIFLVHAVFWPGAIMDHIHIRGRSISDRLEDLPTMVYMPLIGCPWCMAFWWTPAVYWRILWQYQDLHLADWSIPVTAFMCLIMDTIISQIRGT